MASSPAQLPNIPGYRVYRGRRLLHARHLGTYAQACQEHRPWHVVAANLAELAKEVAVPADADM